MISVWPRSLLIGSLIVRIRESELPPAGNGTSRVTGLVGHGCAPLTTLDRSTTAAANDERAQHKQARDGIETIGSSSISPGSLPADHRRECRAPARSSAPLRPAWSGRSDPAPA